MPEGLDNEGMHVRLVRALDLYESLEPSGGAEGMLATQMVATHYAAQECLRRAALQQQTFEGRKMSLEQAHRLMALYIKQLAALDKHRGNNHRRV